MSRHSTAADFATWEDRAAGMSDSELWYSAHDCFKVAALWRGSDSSVEGYYMDQGCTFADALRRRRDRQV